MSKLLIIFLRLLYVMCPFSFAALKSLFFFGLQNFNYSVSWCGSLWIHLTFNSLSLLNVYIHVFNQTGKVFSHWFVKYFLCPFLSSSSSTPTMHTYIDWFDSVPHVPYCFTHGLPAVELKGSGWVDFTVLELELPIIFIPYLLLEVASLEYTPGLQYSYYR